MANTYIQIGSTVTVGSGGASNIDFTSIPSTYTDLIIKTSTRTNNAAIDIGLIISFNGSTTGYNDKTIYGNGSTVAAAGSSGVAGIFWYYADGDTATANTFASGEIYIPNYASSNLKVITMVSSTENNATSALSLLSGGLWSNTAAINRVTITPNGANFKQYTTATLYGIKNS
jgi:hypothetical protein